MIVAGDEHFAYLRIQRGAIERFADDRREWHEALEAQLSIDMGSIVPHLRAWRGGWLLDVGGGLGAIDVLLLKEMPWLEIAILDGVNDPPTVRSHRETFNSARVTRDFFRANGLPPPMILAPEILDGMPASLRFDLVLSLQAWCFHLPPSRYLDWLRPRLAPGARLLLDVRKSEPDWRRQLGEVLVERGVALDRPKFQRVIYDAV